MVLFLGTTKWMYIIISVTFTLASSVACFKYYYWTFKDSHVYLFCTLVNGLEWLERLYNYKDATNGTICEYSEAMVKGMAVYFIFKHIRLVNERQITLILLIR